MISLDVLYWVERALAKPYKTIGLGLLEELSQKGDRRALWCAALIACSAVIGFDLLLNMGRLRPSLVVATVPMLGIDGSVDLQETQSTTNDKPRITSKEGMRRSTPQVVVKKSLASVPLAPSPPPAIAPTRPAIPKIESKKMVDVVPTQDVKKPVDIAPAEKLGIRSVSSGGIVLVNGAKVSIGGALPNGEILQVIDVTRGMVETDRRVLMVTF